MSVAILGTQITLWCLEYGSNSFSVTVGNNNSIFDLKKVILEEILIPGNVKAKDIRLWSVNFDESQRSNSPDELLNDDNEIKIGSRKIGEIFSEVQGNNIRVVVRAPVVTDQPIGEETFSNICDIVRHLRTSEKKAVSTSTSTDIEENLPNIIKHPQNKPFAVIGKPAMYVRDSYEDLYHLIINQASEDSDYKFLVTGTSGIGKSCFLIYFLIKLLCESNDVTIVFQSIQSSFIYCFKNLNLSSGSRDDFLTHLQSSKTWYLADGIISPMLVPAKSIVALSPKGVIKDEFQEYGKDVVEEFTMSPWTLEELLFCRQHVFPNVPEDIMQDLYYKAGGVPRYVFRRVEKSMRNRDPKTKEGKQAIMEKIFQRVYEALLQVKDFNDLILCFNETAYFIQYSSRLIHRWADSSYNHYHLQWASRYIYDEIVKKLENQSWNSLLERVQTMKNYPSARGIMFEMYVKHLFRSSNNQFAMRKLLESPEPTDTPETKEFFMSKPTVVSIRTATELSQHKSDGMLILPDISNPGAADLFYTPDIIFQVTVSENHPIKQAELVKIVENMPAYNEDNSNPISLVLVVPDDIYESYRYQDIVTKDPISKTLRKVNKQDARLKNMQQWVLEVNISASKSPMFTRTSEALGRSSPELSYKVESGSPEVESESGVSQVDVRTTESLMFARTSETLGSGSSKVVKTGVSRVHPSSSSLPKPEVDPSTIPESESSSKKPSRKISTSSRKTSRQIKRKMSSSLVVDPSTIPVKRVKRGKKQS